VHRFSLGKCNTTGDGNVSYELELHLGTEVSLSYSDQQNGVAPKAVSYFRLQANVRRGQTVTHALIQFVFGGTLYVVGYDPEPVVSFGSNGRSGTFHGVLENADIGQPVSGVFYC